MKVVENGFGTEITTDRMRQLLRFAARGIDDVRVNVRVCRTSSGANVANADLESTAISTRVTTGVRSAKDAVAFDDPPGYDLAIKLDANTSHLASDAPWVARRFPEGVPIEDAWEELVALAAYGFQDIKQSRAFRKRREELKTSSGRSARRNRCYLFALRRLNEYRVQQGREPVVESSGKIPQALSVHIEGEREKREARRAPVSLRRFQLSPTWRPPEREMSQEEVEREHLFDDLLDSDAPITPEQRDEGWPI